MKKKLIIVGGGFAGVILAKRLYEKFEITLVDKNDYQTFYPALFKVVSTDAPISEIFSVAAIKLKDVFKEKIEILKKEVVEILPEKNKVIVRTKGVKGQYKDSFQYDYLILATGSEPKSGGLTFNSIEDALRIKNSMEGLFKNFPKRKEIVITVAGGGLTGLGLVAELCEYAHKLADRYNHPHSMIRVQLAEKHSGLLHSGSSWMQNWAMEGLKKMGVLLLFNQKIENIKSDIFISAAGARPVNFGDFKKHKNIFVIETKNAQSAVRQAKYISEVLKAKLKRKKIPKYKPGKFYGFIELASSNAFGEIGIFKFKGSWSRLVHQLAFVEYFIGILTWPQAFRWWKKFRNL